MFNAVSFMQVLTLLSAFITYNDYCIAKYYMKRKNLILQPQVYLRDATVHNPCELNPINITQRFCVDVKLSNNLNLEKNEKKNFCAFISQAKIWLCEKTIRQCEEKLLELWGLAIYHGKINFNQKYFPKIFSCIFLVRYTSKGTALNWSYIPVEGGGS